MNFNPIVFGATLANKTIGGHGGAIALPPAMHIPDGFLSPTLSILFWLLAVLSVGYALRRVNREFDERRVPLMGVLAAVVFAGQMLNFAVTGGTSGHLLGAAIATILLGPWASIVVMACVVGIQALLFQDGGLLALGANIFNMAIVASFVAYTVYQTMQRLAAGRKWATHAAGFLAAWFSIVIASLACALQLALSGTSPANVALPVMGGIHMLIGIGEGLITLGALSFIAATRRDLLVTGTTKAGVQREVFLGGLGIAILLAILSPIASSHPDGLEWVAEQQGFLEKARDPVYRIIPDYIFPGISDEALATILAGVLGTLIVSGVALLTARLNHRRRAIR